MLSPVPVLGGKGGLSSPSMRFCTGFLTVEFELAIERLGGGGWGLRSLSRAGSSRYLCCVGSGEAVEPVADVLLEGTGLERSEGFLLGIGGGPALRRT